MSWLGFVVGLCLLALTWASVVKMLLIPGNMRSVITNVVARSSLFTFPSGLRTASPRCPRLAVPGR